MDVLIRDLDDAVHAELTRRARAADQSLRAYLREVLTEHVAGPSVAQWLANLGELAPIDASGPSGAELVAAARGEVDGPRPTG